MDVIFVLEEGSSFTIEVGYWDTVLEIKEKIQKYNNIPIDQQILIFNSKILQDGGDVVKHEILHNSHVKLVVHTNPDEVFIVTEEMLAPPDKIIIQFRSPLSINHLTVDIYDTVWVLKRKIEQMEGQAVYQLLLHSNGEELYDLDLLRDIGVVENPVVDVFHYNYEQSSPIWEAVGSSGGGGSSKGGVAHL